MAPGKATTAILRACADTGAPRDDGRWPKGRFVANVGGSGRVEPSRDCGGGRGAGRYILGIACLLLSVTSPARADSGPTSKGRSVSLARYTPASAGVFVVIRHLAEADDALDRAHARRLLPLLAGAAVEHNRPFSLRNVIASFIGVRGSVDIDTLMSSEAAFVARSWSQIGSALWLVRISDEAMLAQWFPRNRRLEVGKDGAARIFRTRSGVTVCRRNSIVAIARRTGTGSLFNQTMHLMAGRGNDSLEASTAFQDLMAYLPVRHLTMAYLATSAEPAANQVKTSGLWPAIDRAVVGIYEGQGRIDVAIRASLASPRRKHGLARPAIRRLLLLPQTTLMASATSMDFDRIYEATTEKPQPGSIEGYLALMAAIAGPSDLGIEERARFGPHIVLAWGQDLREGRSTPQLAAIIECANGRAVRDRAIQIAEKMIQLVQALDPPKTREALTIRETRHLGIPIMHLPLRSYAEKSKLPIIRLLANIEPAWTIWRGWLIVALSRDHIERILEAQGGLLPTLARAPDVQALRKLPYDRSMLMVVQAALATDVLEQWLAAHKNGSPSLLDPLWWRGQQRPQLGIGMQVAGERGVVVVARVYPNTAAAGRLKPGDRIHGIDGRLLSLTSPNADLRKRWVESTAQPGPTLRVQRHGLAIDLVLPKRMEGALLSNIRVNPADAVRELASLWRTLQFVSFAVNASDEEHFSARLSLRFAPGHVSNTSISR